MYGLRKALGAPDLLRSERGAYVLTLRPGDQLDLWPFRELMAQGLEAMRRKDYRSSVSLLERALSLWRDPPLADFPEHAEVRGFATALLEDRSRIQEALADAKLESGEHRDLVAWLRTLTVSDPLRERFWEQLMLSLYRSGHQAAALDTYLRVHTMLAEQCGIDPGPDLQDLHRRILAGDPELLATEICGTVPSVGLTPAVPDPAPVASAGAPAAEASPQWQVPHQVPHDLPRFVGRDSLTVGISTLVRDRPRQGLTIVTLSGPPGVGKTALAIHVAHDVAAGFPDGQLFFDLRGYSSGAVATSSEVLEQFLRALGVSPAELPTDLVGQKNLFRSILAGRRVLIILDNATDSPQIRHLLPAGPQCAVLVTSRNSLIGLTAIDDAHHVQVNPFTEPEATVLLSSMIGATRVAAERDATGALAAECGHLPLALRITAAHLAHAPERSIESAVQELRSGTPDPLAVDEDRDATVQNAFDASYRSLSTTLCRLFRMLSLIPGSSFDQYAVASLTGISACTARRMLESLKNANLIYSPVPGGYRLFDLIRDYARERLHEDGCQERAEAFARLFNYYLCTSQNACETVFPETSPGSGLEAPAAEPERPQWTGAEAALAWLQEEERNILAAANEASTRYEGIPVWKLAAALRGYFSQQRCDAAWQLVFTSGLSTATGSENHRAVAEMQCGLADLSFRSGEPDQARDGYRRAGQNFRKLDDLRGQSHVANGLGCVAVQAAAFEDAIKYFACSYALLGHDHPQAHAYRLGVLLNYGVTLQEIGWSEEGLHHVNFARGKGEELGFEGIAARAIAITGQELAWRGDYAAAQASFSEALAMWDRLGIRQQMAETRRNLAEVCLERSDFRQCLTLARQVLRESEELGYEWGQVGGRLLTGLARLELGDVEAATEDLTDAKRRAEAALLYWRSQALVGLAACYRRSSKYAEASALLDEAVSDPRPREKGRAHAERARLALATGHRETAIRHAGIARQIAERHQYRTDEARAGRLQSLASARAAASSGTGS
jgi:tetratricopeptide (TPR) repeat protein